MRSYAAKRERGKNKRFCHDEPFPPNQLQYKSSRLFLGVAVIKRKFKMWRQFFCDGDLKDARHMKRSCNKERQREYDALVAE